MDSTYYMLAATGGLLVLHASQVQPKNTSSSLIANLLSIAFAVIAYWACGFAFAYGKGTGGEEDGNFFLSNHNFFLMDAKPDDLTIFGTNLIDLLMVVVIVNSGFIARLRCWMYPLVTIIVAGFLYPCVYHWIYHPNGWLTDGMNAFSNEKNKNYRLKYVDEGKAGLIHIFGGSVALIASIMIGNRKERKDKKFRALGGNLNPLIVVGGILAIVGLVARNSNITTEYPGGDYLIKKELPKTQNLNPNPALALINNLLAAQASAIIAFTLKRTKVCGDPSGTKALINGAIAGLVGVSCAPHQYTTYYAFVIGIVTGLSYVSWSALFQCCRIDDPTDAAAIHLGSGLWAVLAAPIFRGDAGIIAEPADWRFKLFGWQLLGALAIFVWGGLTLFLIFIPLLASGRASYQEADIIQGLDVFELDDPAFPDKSQYSHDLDTDHIMADIIPASLPRSYENKAYGSNTGFGTLQRIWDQDQDWSVAQY